ncbi:hypothetical protein ACA910_006313 [Epithemia clementina (nom. ined.)]
MKTMTAFPVDILPPMKHFFGGQQNDSCATISSSPSSSSTTNCHINRINHSNSNVSTATDSSLSDSSLLSSSSSSSSTCSLASLKSSDAAELDHAPPGGPIMRARGTSTECSRRRRSYHVANAPLGVNFDENLTVFGEILRGESPATVLSETEQTLAFLDIHPNAPFHGLVIPKRHVPTILNLQPSDQDLLEEMRNTAHALLQEHQPMAWKTGDYILCFHVPPYNSVDHLHLHVLAPKSKMRWRPRVFQYNTSLVKRAVSLDAVQKRLSSSSSTCLRTTKQQGEKSSPVVAAHDNTNSRFLVDVVLARRRKGKQQQQEPGLHRHKV